MHLVTVQVNYLKVGREKEKKTKPKALCGRKNRFFDNSNLKNYRELSGIDFGNERFR